MHTSTLVSDLYLNLIFISIVQSLFLFLPIDL